MFSRQLPLHGCAAWLWRARAKQSLLLLLVCFFTFVGCVQSHRVLSRLFPRPTGMPDLDTHATSVTPRIMEYPFDRQLCQPERLRAHGKFLFLGEEKVYLKGATYGTFAPLNGTQFPSPQNVTRDFALMVAAGMNAVQVYTPPPRWLLDSAWEAGLLVMVGLPWEQHLSFLDYPWLMESIVQRVEEATKVCQSLSGILDIHKGYVARAPNPAAMRGEGKKKMKMSTPWHSGIRAFRYPP
jgi:hypothetical protein